MSLKTPSLPSYLWASMVGVLKRSDDREYMISIRSGFVFLFGIFLSGKSYGFVLTSPSIAPDGQIPAAQIYRGDGCVGANLSPALEWHKPPTATRSFAITIFDPDAPTGFGWWHWVVLNLPPSLRGVPAGAGRPGGLYLPPGVRQIRNSYGAEGYGGPCPPRRSRPHHYRFTLYALNVSRLSLPTGVNARRAVQLIRAHAIGRARFIADFGRP